MASKLPDFILYLVTRSWRKMLRRIHHWSSQGFIYHLGEVDEIALRAAVQPAMSPLQNDTLLSARLIDMVDQNIMEDVTHARTRMPLTITSLLTACQEMQTMPRPDRPDQADEMSGLYNRDTCFEFHQLLISTLLSFGKGLEGYEQAYQNHQSKQDPEEFRSPGELH